MFIIKTLVANDIESELEYIGFDIAYRKKAAEKFSYTTFKIFEDKENLEIIPSVCEFGYYTFATIINNGDSIGSVIILSLDSPMLEQEEKLSSILANILSNYFI